MTESDPDAIVVVAGASHCHQALPSFGAWPKPKMRSGPALVPTKPAPRANDQPVVSVGGVDGDRVGAGTGGRRGEHGREQR